MNFLFDLTASQPNSDGKFHGGGKYTKVIFLNLIRLTSEIAFFAIYNSKSDLDDDIKRLSEERGVKLIDISAESVKNVIVDYSIDRFYSALPYYIPQLNELPCEVIGTIHGLRELETQPDFHSLFYFDKLSSKVKMIAKYLLESYLIRKKQQHFKSLLKTLKVITVSNHTKYSILAHFPDIKDEQVKVFYSPDVTNEQDVVIDTSFKEAGYFLMVSGNRWIKNNLRSAIALDQLFTERSDIKNNVIITGVSNPAMFLKRIKNKNRFIFYKYVDENFLSVLYKNAFALIYMTLNEGFGYPPLEAMKNNVPVIASPFTSITEICGNSVLYSNPAALDEIKNRVLQLFDNTIYYNLQEMGAKRYHHIRTIQDQDLLSMLKYLTD